MNRAMVPKRIGVVVPTLNSVKTLGLTLKSLADQTEVRTEVIVADSGSTDGTLGLCRDFDVRTIYVPKGNMYRAVNAGLMELRHDWVTYLNSDDVVHEGAYFRLTGKGVRTEADLVYGDSDHIDENNNWIGHRYSAPLPILGGLLKGRILPFAQPSCIFKKSLYEKLGGFDERFLFASDLDFFGRAYVSGAVFCRVAESVAAFRFHAAQLSTTHKEAMASELSILRYPVELRSRLPRSVALWAWRFQNIGPLLKKAVRVARKLPTA